MFKNKKNLIVILTIIMVIVVPFSIFLATKTRFKEEIYEAREMIKENRTDKKEDDTINELDPEEENNNINSNENNPPNEPKKDTTNHNSSNSSKHSPSDSKNSGESGNDSKGNSANDSNNNQNNTISQEILFKWKINDYSILRYGSNAEAQCLKVAAHYETEYFTFCTTVENVDGILIGYMLRLISMDTQESVNLRPYVILD